MKYKWIKVEDVVIGVVYRYYTADGKSYVGCTTNEQKRRYAWNWKNNPYGGVKIAAARRDLGLDAFNYERLYVIIVDSKDGLDKQLEGMEAEFIKKFDSHDNGYNTSKGGHGNKGNKMPNAQKEKIRKSSKKKAVRLTPDNGGPERDVESMMEVSRQLNINVGLVYYYANKANTKSVAGYKLKCIA